MRELSSQEINQVGGGLAPWVGAAAVGFAQGAFVAGTTSYLSGASWQRSLGSAALGGFASAFSGVAGVTTGALKAVNYVRSTGLGIAAGTITASGPGVAEVDDYEKLEEK